MLGYAYFLHVVRESQNCVILGLSGKATRAIVKTVGMNWLKDPICPSCGVNLKILQAQESSREKNCPRCGAIMRVGYVVEKDPSPSLWTLVSGIYWTPGEAGVIGERVEAKAYACLQCGYIDHYVRYRDGNKKTILSAPHALRE